MNAARMNADRFRQAFAHLMLPITTANEHLVPGWCAADVWAPFWATVTDHFATDPVFRQVLTLVMDFERFGDSTEDARRALQDFVDRHVPGYRLLFEADVIPALNQIFARDGATERVLGFRYGKDGRGAMPDRYYHLLLRNKFLVVGNHHDILGHFALFCDPRIRAVTEGLAAGFADTLEFEHGLRRRGPARPPDAETLPLRRSLRLYTLAWNLTQEKLYVQVPRATGRTLNLIGAFNSVYNTIFSAKLGPDQVRVVAGALGFFSRDPLQSILMTPKALTEFCRRATDDPADSTLNAALTRYADLWRGLGFDPATIHESDLHGRFEAIVARTLFRRGVLRTPSVRRRWLDFSAAVLGDPDLCLLFDTGALVGFAEALSGVAAALFARERDRLAALYPPDVFTRASASS